MNQTRRRFVRSAAALGTAALLPWKVRAQSEPVRVSLEAFSKDAGRVASLRKGVAVMKARPPSDHRSWFFQAAIHAYNDAAYQEALSQDSKVAQVDAQRFWNKCPHFGQSSADFLIWHRAYLYNFEQILRDAAGDPTLALPYWDYSKPENRTFPQIFADQIIDGTANPLYHPNRELAFVSGRFDLSPEVGEAPDTMGAATFFSEVGITGFGGDILDSQHTQLGLVEQRPHNDIHIAVGGVVGSANGAMADVPTAAFDPVFWVHHANIDRLWAEWAAMPGKDWGPLPSPEWFDEAPWEFMTLDGSVTRFGRRAVMDRSSIAIAYDTDSALNRPPLAVPPAPVMAAAPPTGGAAPAGEHAPPTAAPPKPPVQERELVADATPLRLSASAPTAHPLTRGPLPVGAGAPGTRNRAPRRVLLELSDIRFERVPSSGFAVYLLSAAEVAAGRPGSFVGLLDLFGATHARMKGMAMMGTAQRFDVTPIVEREGLDLTLRVAPYDLLVSKEGASAPKRADEVKIGKVRFVEVT